MDVRYSVNPRDLERYSQEELRKEFLVESLFRKDEIHSVYSFSDRAVILGIMPILKKLNLNESLNCQASFGVSYFLERRELGLFNVGGVGTIVCDGRAYKLGYKDCLYVTCGTRELSFYSEDKENPSKFFAVSFPAVKSFETRLIKIQDARKKNCGEESKANKRVINQFIHPEVLRTSCLSMGLTTLSSGSVWNTMPCHTHERRMEVYFYFELGKGEIVFHFMGEKRSTKHIVLQNEEAVISPSYSIHSGVGTSSYSFIWAMAGENLNFDDMDNIKNTELR